MLIVDFSTSNATGKRVIVTSSINGNILSDTGIINPSTNPIILDTTGWSVVDRAIIIVQLGYVEPGSAGNSVSKGYIAPLTLNIQS